MSDSDDKITPLKLEYAEELTMTRRTPVAELALELDVPIEALLEMLRSEGIVVKSGRSTVERSIAQRVRAVHHRRGAADPAPEPLSERAPEHRSNAGPDYVLFSDNRSSVVHHRDYLLDRTEYALCGYRFGVATEVGSPPTDSHCSDCVARLPAYELLWWQARCGALDSELNRQQILNGHLQKECKRYKKLHAQLEGQIQHVKQRDSARKPKTAGRSSRGKAMGPIAQRRRAVPPPAVKRTPDPEKVRRRVQEMNAPRPRKTQAERWADEAAADKMRSQKPSTWRVGGSPSSFGNGL